MAVETLCPLNSLFFFHKHNKSHVGDSVPFQNECEADPSDTIPLILCTLSERKRARLKGEGKPVEGPVVWVRHIIGLFAGMETNSHRGPQVPQKVAGALGPVESPDSISL